MLTLFIAGLEFYGYHGVSVEEQSVGHRYTVELELEVRSAAQQTDNVVDTVDYAQATALTLRICGEPCKTMEFLAQRIGDALLAEFPLIDSVEVTVAKLLPPIPAIAASAGVRHTVCRV